MAIDYEHIEIKNNPEEQRYEAWIDGKLAELAYEQEGKRIVYIHTGVPPELSGHGIANKLAFFALEEARQQQLSIVPDCPFVAAYIRHHPEYQDRYVCVM